MDDFLTYFLAGMLGEELLRKIATRPFGFWVLWLMGFVLFNMFIVIALFSLGLVGVFKQGISEPSLLSFAASFAHALLIFFFVTIQPWAALMALGMGLLFALGYRLHYRRNTHDKSAKS